MKRPFWKRMLMYGITLAHIPFTAFRVTMALVIQVDEWSERVFERLEDEK